MSGLQKGVHFDQTPLIGNCDSGRSHVLGTEGWPWEVVPTPHPTYYYCSSYYSATQNLTMRRLGHPESHRSVAIGTWERPYVPTRYP